MMQRASSGGGIERKRRSASALAASMSLARWLRSASALAASISFGSSARDAPAPAVGSPLSRGVSFLKRPSEIKDDEASNSSAPPTPQRVAAVVGSPSPPRRPANYLSVQ